jgi:hypothetical protein
MTTTFATTIHSLSYSLVQDFLGTQSCPSESRIASRMKRKLSSSSSSSAQSFSATGVGPSDEEAELEEAIRLSLRQGGDDEDTAVVSGAVPVPDLTNSATEAVVVVVEPLNGFSVAEVSATVALFNFLVILSDQLSQLTVSEPPPDELGLVKTIFRLPRGGKAMRSFASSAPLKDVAIFAAQQVSFCALNFSMQLIECFQIVAADASLATGGARFEASFNFPQVLLSGMAAFDTQSLQSAGIITGSAIVIKML